MNHLRIGGFRPAPSPFRQGGGCLYRSDWSGRCAVGEHVGSPRTVAARFPSLSVGGCHRRDCHGLAGADRPLFRSHRLRLVVPTAPYIQPVSLAPADESFCTFSPSPTPRHSLPAPPF